MNCADDSEIERRFLEASFPSSIRNSLLEFLSNARYPIAVRSSSLLEDSQYQPFTGVYETFMLANHHPELSLRLGSSWKRSSASMLPPSASMPKDTYGPRPIVSKKKKWQ